MNQSFGVCSISRSCSSLGITGSRHPTASEFVPAMMDLKFVKLLIYAQKCLELSRRPDVSFDAQRGGRHVNDPHYVEQKISWFVLGLVATIA